MAYHVRFTGRAERDLALLFDRICAEESRAAERWYWGLMDAILSLEHMPNRCVQTAEDKRLRQLPCGKNPDVYRVIFRVIEQKKTVQILHIRHGARRAFRPPELHK